ncbi:CycA [Drosophila busckii]|uniref:CycA n=2 Tax=Drosophila busckii TaxID=30019 RepID=A0A0M4EID5_DROBS|nr:CycA [Drosophila busckii]
MRRQVDINHSMRSILVDWLVEVAEEYKLDTETLYLAVAYMDRFLSQMSVKRAKLQLVGTAAMYIASKYEEIYPPDVGEFVFLTDNTYTKAQVLRLEQVLLKILSFNLCTPTAYVFINTYAVICDMPEKLKNLTLYIAELSLLDGESYMQYLPSMMSAGALALARHMLGLAMWTPQLEEITTYNMKQLKDLVLMLYQTHKSVKSQNTQAIREKYNRDKYKKIASTECIELNEAHFDALMQQEEQQQRPNENSQKQFVL